MAPSGTTPRSSRRVVPGGWAYLANRYDDLAFCDGKLDRPVLQRLLKDAEAGPIDVVMAYKIDRLTCSPSDFVQLVEVSTHI
jgi:site-specific DNA recombinase